MRRIAVCLVLLLPIVAAHGADEASELEIEVLADEASDVISQAGYDVTQVFVGEAHLPEVGEAEGGDGFYFRTTLYGDPSAGPAPTGAWRAVFTFDAPGGAVTRTLSTTDGSAFESDFDALVTENEGTSVKIERAFVSYASAGLAVGDAIRGFRVETFVGDRPVDVAPGGWYPVPGVEAPTESRVVVDEVVLGGVGRYVDVAAEAAAEGAITLRVTSLLKEGAQHVHLAEARGVTVEGPSSVNLKATETATFVVRLAEGATRLDVLTDIGGRDSILVAPEGAGWTLTGDTGVLLAAADGPARAETPSPAWAALVGLAAVAFLARRK